MAVLEKVKNLTKKDSEITKQNPVLQAGIEEPCTWEFLVQLADEIKTATGITDGRQLEHLVEQAYLSYKDAGRSLEKRVISFIEAVAKGKFGATAPEKKAALNATIDDIKTSDQNQDDDRETAFLNLKKLMKEDKVWNASREQEELPESFRDVNVADGITFCDGIVLLPARGTLYVVGDTHGNAKTVKGLVDHFRKSLKGQDDVYVVFLGDYVNNGLNSIQTLVSVLTLKQEFPKNVVLLSGNHEFGETYFTAIREYFEIHWENAESHPDKHPPSHYGHIRLELAKKFGIERCETLYSLFAEWGRSLPYIAYSAQGVMMSHSIGLPLEYFDEGNARALNLEDLAQAKRGQDEREFERLGYEAWKQSANTLHACMVNGRSIDSATLEQFQALGAKVFVVGHSHYRSGDIHVKGDMIADDIDQKGILVTLCSSVPDSQDAGHYIGHQFGPKRICEQGEGRSGLAKACIVE
ncbi:MAG: serine/threonine protein phosphatase, partial [Proteobacteria bacterium]|nr:serine/threonine protein phosphatase [Pseudomonadota bacterium]